MQKIAGEDMGGTFDHEYADEAISGGVPAAQHPGFADLLAFIRKGDTLHVYAVDRQGRDGRSTGHEFSGGPRSGGFSLRMPAIISTTPRIHMRIFNAIARGLSNLRAAVTGLLFLGFLGVGLLQMVFWVAESSSSVAAMFWPTSTGVIESAEVVKKQSGGRTSFTPTVIYSYSVDGASYSGRHIYYSSNPNRPDPSEFEGEAERTISQFPEGSRATVYYKAGRPEHSMLKPGLNWFSLVWLLINLVAVTVGIVGTYYTRRRKTQR